MKKFILIIFTFLICSQKPAISGEVAMIAVVDGMICLDCQKKVTKELKAATGENDINVSWQEGVAFINFSGSTSFTEKDFKNVIEDAGFNVGKVAKIDQKIQDSKSGLVLLSKF
jgi:copper chaperone CopZ